MANFAITDYVTDAGTVEEVMALLETYIETLTDDKTLHYVDIIQLGSALFQGVVLHKA